MLEHRASIFHFIEKQRSNDSTMSRLSGHITPHHYNIKYTKLDIENGVFDGNVQISLTINRETTATTPTSSISLHVVDLQITEGYLLREHQNQHQYQHESIQESDRLDNKYGLVELKHCNKNQICELVFDCFDLSSAVSNGEDSFLLYLEFRGELNRQMKGLYRSEYIGLDKCQHVMACTQFEATDARRAFPCFDEPSFKATFELSVTLKSHLVAISNTPVESTDSKCLVFGERNEILKTWKFEKTPKMSTYLVALVVGRFDYISTTSPTTRIQTSVYTVPGKSAQGKFCLNVASKCLDLYEDMFKVPYPLPKSDLLAIPDFGAGAMENWGCVTYREAKILVQKEATSQSTLQGIARTVCHELAHQWFGNLVTMNWWKELWLNEGFARFMEFVGVNELFPQWNVWDEFVQSVYGVALSLDAMESSHPVEVDVQTSDEISEIFDTISYAKGASIIRMCSEVLGFETFMKGLKIYLNNHRYGNATTEMLWESLSEASGSINISSLMASWTTSVGYPVVILPEDGDNLVTPRYLASGPGNDKENAWKIPVTVIIEDNPNQVLGPWIINDPQSNDLDLLMEKVTYCEENNKWFKLNSSQTGFYRVSYTKAQWGRLARALLPDSPLAIADRLGLLSDSFAMGRAGYASIVESLDLARSFAYHTSIEFNLWQELSENLMSLGSLYRGASFFPKYQLLLTEIYEPQFKRLGWEPLENESSRAGSLRATIIRVLGIAGSKAVQMEALQRFRLFANDSITNPISGDLRSVIFKISMDAAEDEVFDKLQLIFENSEFPEVQRDCLMTMGRCKDMERHSKMINYVLYSGKVRLQDAAFPFVSLTTTSNEGGRACWYFVKENYEKLASLYKKSPFWGSLVAFSCRGLKTLKEIEEVLSFWNKECHDAGSGKRRLRQAVEAVQTNAQRLNRDRDLVSQYLDDNFPSIAS